MKDSCPDLLLLETLHAHTAINYSSTEARGQPPLGWDQGQGLVPGQSCGTASGSVQSSWEAQQGVEGCGSWNSGINAAF